MLQIFRDPRRKRLVLVAPILQLLLFGYAVTTDVRDVATVVVDHDRTQASRSLQEVIQAGGYFRVVQRTDRSEDAGRALDRGDAVVALEIRRGFERDLAAARGARVQVLVDGTNSNTATVAQGYLGRIVQQFGLDYASAHGTALPAGVDLRPRAWYNPALLSQVYNVPAVVAALITIMCLLLTSLSVVNERELGTLEQLMVSPLSATEMILGKTLPVALIAFLDLALVVTVALGWFRVPFAGSMTLLVFASTLYILAALGMGLLISTLSRTQQEAFMGMFLVLMPMIILSGFMYPIRSMPLFFQRLTLLNPLRHFMEIVRAIFLKGAGFMDLWPQFAAISAFAVVLLALAIWRFRASLG
jgi:ABC-2 type transport system permease protein